MKFKPGQKVKLVAKDRNGITDKDGSIFIISDIHHDIIELKPNNSRFINSWIVKEDHIEPYFNYREQIRKILD